MGHEEVGRYWDENAEVWTELVRAGYDHYRDGLNTPDFLEMLPEVNGLSGLDVGCGEGHNTRLVAARGANMTGIDISRTFIHYAREAEKERPLGIHYEPASAEDLPFERASFDFAVAFMSLMDIPETERVLAEAFRVLRAGGFLQFTIGHPCFATPYHKNLRDHNGLTYAHEVGDYFRKREGEVEEWIFSAAPADIRENLRPFRVPLFTRTLSEWLNSLIEAGFVPERFGEPYPSDKAVRERPGLQDAQIVAYFLHVRARKLPGGRASRNPRRPTRVARSARSELRILCRRCWGTRRASWSRTPWPWFGCALQ
jgi:SAM-dependent methyltransferase